ncbi:hypothetical protein GTA26_24780 [Rhodococcus hoagii]|nr:hypothetical protein [Prescottella equi]
MPEHYVDRRGRTFYFVLGEHVPDIQTALSPEASTDRVPNLLISEQWKQVSEQVFVPWATR